MMYKSQLELFTDCLVSINTTCTDNQKCINLLRQEQAYLRKMVEGQSGVIKILTKRIEELLVKISNKTPTNNVMTSPNNPEIMQSPTTIIELENRVKLLNYDILLENFEELKNIR